MVYLKTEQGCLALEHPVYILRLPNGMLIRTEQEHRAQGILDEGGEKILQLQGRESLGEEFHRAEPITYAEYAEWLGEQEPVTDPEDTEPQIPEGLEEESVLTRAELTERVRLLEEELAKAMALLYPKGEEVEHEP